MTADDKRARFARSKRRQATIVAGAVVVLLGGGVVWFLFLRGPKVVELQTFSGAAERCISCHPDGALRQGGKAHPKIAGHDDLRRLGCTPCHGGIRSSLDEQEAHSAPAGSGAAQYFPAGHAQAGCARCHVVGKLAGAELLDQGQREYLDAGCPGCHAPGRRTPGLGIDLRQRQPRPIAELRQRLIDPLEAPVDGGVPVMWTLRDPTYGGHYGAGESGDRAIRALVVYLLALADRREAYRAIWVRPELRIDQRSCSTCHTLDGKPTKGVAHACPLLADDADLRCARCHDRPETRPADPAGRCPQIAGALPLCSTCHLRPGDGHDKLGRPVPPAAAK